MLYFFVFRRTLKYLVVDNIDSISRNILNIIETERMISASSVSIKVLRFANIKLQIAILDSQKKKIKVNITSHCIKLKVFNFILV